jgi:hypothetical protein
MAAPQQQMSQMIMRSDPEVPMNIATKKYVDEMVGTLKPPKNIDAPYVHQEGAVLKCTKGNWYGEPTTYAYQWSINGNPAGTDAETYNVLPGDVGGTANCVVSATNDLGTTEGPASNDVVVS